MIDVSFITEDLIKFILDDDVPIFYRYHLYHLMRDIIERSKSNEQRTKKINAT